METTYTKKTITHELAARMVAAAIARAKELGAFRLIGLSHFSRATVVGGGLPIRVDGELVGGIGVGGGTVEQDVACAHAGLDALTSEIA